MEDEALRLLLFFQAEDGIRDLTVTGVQTCALPISLFRADVELASPRVCSDTLYVLSRLARGHVPGWNSLYEFIARIDVVDQKADAAVFQVIANARNRDIEPMLFLFRPWRSTEL